ncbi:MAG: hypothetical protein ILP18_00065, partial [Treponema sp.]|nr:hypothetical protein [Treponema sp.]
MPRLHTFFTLFMGTALALASFTSIISCNGNGGSSYSEGDIYTPGGSGGGTVNGPQGRSGSGFAGGDISAIDILEMSNAGDTDGIVAIFQPATSTGGESAGSQTVVLNAAAIGMPSDGTATLSITGRGINYEVTATVDAD